MRIHKIGVALLALTSSSAYAESIYLDCIASSAKGTHSFSVTIDENTRRITHQNKNGNAFNADGFFTAGEIAYKNVSCASKICITHQYIIDRITLSIKYLFRAEPIRKDLGVAPREIVSTGSCSVIKVPERKI